jgi:hypothetical protein
VVLVELKLPLLPYVIGVCVVFRPVVDRIVDWELDPEVTDNVDPVWEAVALDEDDDPTKQVPAHSKSERLKLIGLPSAPARLVLNENV